MPSSETVTVASDRVLEMYLGKIPAKSEEYFLAITAYDDQFTSEVLDLAVRYDLNGPELTTNVIASRLIVRDDQGRTLFSSEKVVCEFE